jgi:catalase
VNYEPNSWGGPRADPVSGYKHFPAEETGRKAQVRSATFADHYSQARQFFISQLPIEQKHIGDALVFELSKVERVDIRQKMVAHLRNIDETLATVVADGLGLPEMPAPFPAAVPTRTDLPPSDALSIVKRGPQSFEGRKLGIVVSDGASAKLVKALIEAVEALPAVYEIIAPKIAGATLDDGTMVEAKQKIDGGPSVLYDAVALVLSADGGKMLAEDKTAKDFVSDAFGHGKFIGYTSEAAPLLQRAGVTADDLDEGTIELGTADQVTEFLDALGELRVWARELTVDLDAAGFLKANAE